MTAPVNGCRHVINPNGATCNKVCDPGETICPHHKLLIEAKRPPASAPPADGQRRYKTPRAYQE